MSSNHQFLSTLSRIAFIVAAALLIAILVISFAAKPASVSACHPVISAAGACQQDGTRLVTWTIGNSEAEYSATIYSINRTLIGVGIGSVIPAGGSIIGTEILSGLETGTIKLGVAGDWTNGQQGYTSGSIDLGQACPQPCRYDPQILENDPLCFDPCVYNPAIPAEDPACFEPCESDPALRADDPGCFHPCQYNPEIAEDDPACFEPCRYNPAIAADDPKCKKPKTDVCSNIDGNQASVPDGMQLEDGRCVAHFVVGGVSDEVVAPLLIPVTGADVLIPVTGAPVTPGVSRALFGGVGLVGLGMLAAGICRKKGK